MAEADPGLDVYKRQGLDEAAFRRAVGTVFSEPQVDDTAAALPAGDCIAFGVEPLPGQFDQRADSAAQCLSLIHILQAVESETLGSLTVEWRHASAACVILASGGYPGHYEKGKPISLPASAPGNVTIYHAGDRLDENGQLVTSGGRVLGVTATGPTLRQALHDAYAAARAVDFDGKYLRHDIGQRALAALAD